MGHFDSWVEEKKAQGQVVEKGDKTEEKAYCLGSVEVGGEETWILVVNLILKVPIWMSLAVRLRPQEDSRVHRPELAQKAVAH